ncbi:MAG TPA: GlpM family protein [Longimicrobium sp.]
MATLFLRMLVGAVAVLVIALLSRTRSYFIAGLVPLFPSLALIAHYIVGSERSAADLRETALFGMWSLIPYFVYLLAVYFLIARLPLVPTLAAATLAWLVVAAILVTVWMRFHPAAG